jgi:hypothetical protein
LILAIMDDGKNKGADAPFESIEASAKSVLVAGSAHVAPSTAVARSPPCRGLPRFSHAGRVLSIAP